MVVTADDEMLGCYVYELVVYVVHPGLNLCLCGIWAASNVRCLFKCHIED